MTEPTHLRTTRAAYHTVAVDYAALLREPERQEKMQQAFILAHKPEAS